MEGGLEFDVQGLNEVDFSVTWKTLEGSPEECLEESGCFARMAPSWRVAELS